MARRKALNQGHAFSDFVSEERFKHGRPRMSSTRGDWYRLIPVVAFIGVFILLSLRLFYLQVLRNEYFSRLSNENRIRTEIIPADRGIIMDRNGKPLVANSAAFKMLGPDNKVVWLENDQALDLLADGKPVENDIRRDYIYKDAFAHVVGYIGQITAEQTQLAEYEDYGLSDFVGRMGLEAQYEKTLHGANGKKLFEVDAMGKKIRELGSQEPVPGSSIVTTLDLEIQKSVHEAMKDVEKGAVVVSDPKDGGILALYSKPNFDPNLFTHSTKYKPVGTYTNIQKVLTDTKQQPLLDRAISGTYPPGSTYKLVSATAGLEEKAVDSETIIEDNGQITVGGATFGNWYFLQYGRTEGAVDIVKAISRSNDIYFYRLGERTGIEGIYEWSKKFKLGEKLGIDLPHEEKGLVPSREWKQKTLKEDWYTGDSFNLGIGQGYLLTTPLQVNMFTSVFANDGTLYKPHLIKDDVEIIRNKMVSGKNHALVREGMKNACSSGGTGYSFFDFKVKNSNLKIDGRDYLLLSSESARLATDSANMVRIQVGCKTGTAETGGKETKPHAWITVFAPFHNPEVVVTVLAENSGEGSQVAGPIATEILTKYFEEKK